MFVPMGDPIKISRLRIRNTSRAPAAAFDHGLRGMGARHFARVVGAVHSDRARCGERRAVRPQSVGCHLRLASRFRGSRRTAIAVDRGPRRIPRPPRHSRNARSLDRAGAAGRARRRRPGSVLRTADIDRAASRARPRRSSSSSARPRTRRPRGRCSLATAAPISTRCFEEVIEHWELILGAVQVKTPDRSSGHHPQSLDALSDTRLPHLGASAFYQASGAYGFRDQLQDGMALAVVRPDLTREHLLRAGGRQFSEGDVQHWWLPPVAAGATGQGVRTRISDDVVWLAYCAIQYIETTGDAAVLDEKIPFLEGRALQPEEHDAFFMPGISDETATLFEHCARALDHALQDRRARPAVVRDRGLERRDEPGRREGQGRKRLARMVPAGDAGVVRPRGRGARRAWPRNRWLAHAAALEKSARTGVGRRLVPARLLRRRNAAGICLEQPSAGSTRSRNHGA